MRDANAALVNQDPPGFLMNAARAEGWSVLDERRCLILSHLLVELRARSLALRTDPHGERILTVDTGGLPQDQCAILSRVDPKPTLDALRRLVLQLEARERERFLYPD
jgi:hypothetical protein